MAVKTTADSALWHRAMRGVKPLTPRAPSRPPAPTPLQSHERPAPSASAGQPVAAPAPSSPLRQAGGYDRANAERLRRGRHPIEARIDLHGMTQDEAHRALARFIGASRAAGRRCVLVITGRGKIGGGVLRAAVPRWLEEPAFRPHLLAIATAQPRDGGAGAIYVMLRRTRPAND